MGRVSYQFDERASALGFYEQVTDFAVLIEFLVPQSNLCFQENRRNFLANAKEVKAFISVSYITGVNQLLRMS